MSCNIDSIDMLMIFFIRKIKLSHYINDTMQQKNIFLNISTKHSYTNYIVRLYY